MDVQTHLKSPVQQAVVQAVAQVLALEHVELRHNFFELGGSSLSVALVTEQLESELGLQCPMQLLYENPVLGDFADALSTSPTLGSDA